MPVTSTGTPGLIILWRQGSVMHGRTVKIGGDVASVLGEFAKDCALNLDADAPVYDPDSPSEDNSLRTAPREEAFDTELLDALSMGTSHPKATTEDFARRIICWAVVLGQGADQTIFVHKNSPVQLARKPLVAGLVDDSLRRMTEKLLAFDPNFDMVVTPDKLYILDEKDFEGLFKESDAVLARAKEWSETLTTKLSSTAESAGALEEVLRRNGVIRRKVTSIIRRPYFETITIKEIKSKLKAHGLDEATYLKAGKLNFNSDTITDLVRFLNEDLFQGDFSAEQFAASGKQRLGVASK